MDEVNKVNFYPSLSHNQLCSNLGRHRTKKKMVSTIQFEFSKIEGTIS
jgi:hypothetical protein